jgi:anti-sigma regulatory factor (Ser/Thr protein kinase)
MMQSEERPVAIARLTRPATAATIGEARRWATMFAGEHGMERRQQDDLEAAVSEAVTGTVNVPESGEVGDVDLAIATDGDWLTVRIEDRGCATGPMSYDRGLGLMTTPADRIEFGPSVGGDGTTVLMEFPVSAGDRVRSAERPS